MTTFSTPPDLIKIAVRPGIRDRWEAGTHFVIGEAGDIDLDRGIYLIHESQPYDPETETQKLLVERLHP